LNYFDKNYVKTVIQVTTLAFNEIFNGYNDILSQAISMGVLILLISF